MLRTESKARARALQALYAWEIRGRPLPAELDEVGFGELTGVARERARRLFEGVVANYRSLDREIAQAVEHWRIDRVGAVERNILRLALHELLEGDVPPVVVIDEAVRLARWFGGTKAPAFVNGVLDATARRLGLL
ncbi:MAG: N utilization substance protein B [Gemmatimonadales bacterium]|nr:N utilization substance protein B [bacterium HR33]GIW51272.1 MAG: N utilization substance protein B [Gemmatimonadales bacterium]